MKRITALVLTVMLLSGIIPSLGSTYVEAADLAENITAATADAEEYGIWLQERLDTEGMDIVLGIGSSDAYGIDMSDFENDGYIIKEIGDSTVIFGKTADALDLAVHKFANLTEEDGDTSYIVYHEGYRIDEFRLFGTDISAFAIEYPAEHNENMLFAVSELQKLVKKACGVELASYEGTAPTEHKIIFRHTDDESLRDDGFNYFEENGCLVIEGAVDRGCMNGVYRFLENECGWRHLIFGTSILEEASLLDIPAGLYVSETPAFDYVDDWINSQRHPYVNDRTPLGFNSVENSYGPVMNACHGMYTWSPETGDIDCYTSEEFYEVVYSRVYHHLESCVASGQVVGEQLKSVDIAQKDCPEYCRCENCSEVYDYDKSFIGPLVQFANNLAEDLREDFDGIKVLIFGYFRTIRPPEVTVLDEDVYITYAPNGNCARHSLSEGELCNCKLYQDWNNVEYGGFLERWCEMSDHVYVWYYSWGLFPKAYTMVDVFYKDLKFFAEIGVKGIYINRMDELMDTTFLTDYMLRELSWEYDMTEEEFEEYLAVLMQDVYGDGWEYVREADRLLRESHLRANECLDIWQYVSIVPKDNTYDPFFYDTVFEDIVELMERAMELCATDAELYACGGFAGALYYMGVTGGYFPAYDRGDTERLEWLESMHTRMLEIGDEIGGYAPTGGSHLDISGIYLPYEELMWTYFADFREIYTLPGTEMRPAPDWVTAE